MDTNEKIIDSKLVKELNNATDTTNIKLKWEQDPKGYFTIKPFPIRRKVYVRYYKDNKLEKTFSGINTSQIVQKLIEEGLISRLDHAAYLGKEIEKAIIALENNLDYVQDEKLRLKKEGHSFKARIFSEIVTINGKKYEHFGCKDDGGKLGDFLAKNVGKNVEMIFRFINDKK